LQEKPTKKKQLKGPYWIVFVFLSPGGGGGDRV
jgi:hypothetical protein